MLHNRRKRLERLAAEEAAGTSFWTDTFDESVRLKIWYAFIDSAVVVDEVAGTARSLILRDEGLPYLAKGGATARNDFERFVMSCDDGMMPTAVEAIARGMAEWDRYAIPEKFGNSVRTILREHRVSFDFIDGQMIEFSSREMHEAVVAPALHLLAGRPDLDGAERAYQEALEEIAKGKAADAITDVGTALQETLTSLGCEGNALGPLIKSARARGLLAAHDSPMLDAIEKVMHWVSADRSETGDAHAASTASVADAWLMVHVVGALILRLADQEKRAG